MRTAAGAAGLAVTSPVWMPTLARAATTTAEPRPIPGGTTLPFGFFHFFFPGHCAEPSSITDFKGFVGVADVEGTGRGTDPETGDIIDLTFGADMRFMKGTFIGLDGASHFGTFAFI